VNGYLLDTNIVSEARKEQRTNPNVRRWFESIQDETLFLSVLVLGEIRKGIEQARSRDIPKARALERWLNTLENTYADRILDVTIPIVDQWGRLSAMRPISPVDGLMAATALVHDLVFVTRNAADVVHTAAKVLNPFDL